MRPYAGSCHCGNLRVTFETPIAPDALEVRACQCTFCRRHGSHTASDPAGLLTISATDPSLVSRYDFGLKTCEFLICRSCGCYVAAVLREGSRMWGVLNINMLGARALFTRPPRPMDYADEDAAARIARRKERWTPTMIDLEVTRG